MRAEIEVTCPHKAGEMSYKAPCISYAVVGLVLNLAFHIEDPDEAGYTVKNFLFPDLSLSASSEAALVARRWDTALDSSMLATYTYTTSLL